MRKFAMHSTVLLLLTVLLAATGAAQRPGSSVPQSPHDYLSGLAAYAPHDTLVYAAARTDADSIAAMNALSAELAAGLPDIAIPSFEALIDSTGVSFDELRPWVGDSIAIAMVPDNSRQSDSFLGVVIVHLADPEAAEAYLTPLLGTTAVEWRNDVVIFGDEPVLRTLEAGEYPNLHQQPLFNDAIGALDAPLYAGLA